MRYIILILTLMFSFVSFGQNITWRHIIQEIEFYDRNLSEQKISSMYSEKYNFSNLKSDKDIYFLSPGLRTIPFSSLKEKILFQSSFMMKFDNRDKGRKYNRQEIEYKMDKIFTKEKILEFLKESKINNSTYFENQKLIEAYQLCQFCPKKESGNTYSNFLIIFDNDAHNYDDYLKSNYGDWVYTIRIKPDDLIDIPPSPEANISENILKLANYIVSELDKNLIVELDKGPRFYEKEGFEKANKNGDYEGAIRSFNKAIELAENPWSDLFRGRGVVKKAMGNCLGAIDDFKRALNLLDGLKDEIYIKESTKLILLDLAYCKIFNENPDAYGAIFDCNEVIKLDPNSARAFGLRGIAKVTINDIKGACSDVKKASILGDNRYEKQLSPFCNN